MFYLNSEEDPTGKSKYYGVKALGGRRICTMVFSLFFNRFTRRLTVCGWATLIILVIVIIKSTYQGSTEPADVSEKEIHLSDKRDLIVLNPKFNKYIGKLNPDDFKMKDPDPQEEDFKLNGLANKHGKVLKLPIFDANKHNNVIASGQKSGKQNEHSKPRPKMFPVKIEIAPATVCPDQTVVLILVFTSPQSIGERYGIRESWGVYDAAKFQSIRPDQKWATIFVMGKANNAFDKKAKVEAETYGDILQGEFTDSPHEDTRKFMMALKWYTEEFAERCKPAYVIKTNDNIFHNMPSILSWLEYKFQSVNTQPRDLYIGKILRQDRPIRDETNPLFVPSNDFRGDFFPDFIRGPEYLFSVTAYMKLYEVMNSVTPIAMEDAYVGLLAQKAKIAPRDNDHFQMVVKTKNICHHLKMFFIFNIRPIEHIKIYRENKRARESPECKGAGWVNRERKVQPIEN